MTIEVATQQLQKHTPINSKVHAIPRIPGTEQSKCSFLLLSLAILTNLSICNQAELNQKKKLKGIRKEPPTDSESWCTKSSGKGTKSPFRNSGEVPPAPSRAPAGSAAAPPPTTTPWMQLLKPWRLLSPGVREGFEP